MVGRACWGLTVRDRVAQQALKIVIEPLFEANFLPCSFGYRPKRSAGQVVLASQEGAGTELVGV